MSSKHRATNQAVDTRESGDDRDFSQALEEHFRAGYQAMLVTTSEEARAEAEIARVAASLKMHMVTWDCFEGFSSDKLSNDLKGSDYRVPAKALEAIEHLKGNNDGDYVFVFRDLDDYWHIDAQVRRRIRSLVEGNRLVNKSFKRPIIILTPKLAIHDKLKSSLAVIDFALPDENKLRTKVDHLRHAIVSKDQTKSTVSDELREQIATNLLGLTINEAENCLSRCLVRHGGFHEDMLQTIKDEKAAIIKKSDVLTYIPEGSVATRDEIGGFEMYMEWLDRRKLAYSLDAQSENLDFPKGVILVGVPGTGKSVVAKATCMVLGLPGYILDIGSLFDSLVGASEQRTRDVLKQLDAQKGCVLVLDEADKALGNAHASQGDSGVTRRVFGTILTWLAEHKSRTFVIMTLNRTEGLPPELLRAGRFDAMFYTDVPHAAERRQIMEIHFRKRGVDPAALQLSDEDWSTIITKTENYVGSELEEIVRESRYMAWETHRSGVPTLSQIMEAVASVIPMATRDAEGLQKIRDFCTTQGKPVTARIAEAPRSRNRQRAVDLKAGNN